MALIEVQNLTMHYETLRGEVRAVENVSFNLEKGRALGLAGESGCGKTSIALSILRLLPSNAKVKNGRIVLDGINLLEMGDKQFKEQIRWTKLSVVFQGAMNALHPIFTVGDQISEAIVTHERVSKKEALDRACKLLDLVGVKAERIDRYPHELSGGMKQRVVIAMALACNPLLVIADEPTTALDVIVQAQVMRVMRELQKKLDLSIVVISHDLSMIARTCDEVAIMYAGKIVENGNVAPIFANPLHPYTQRLLGAFPSVVGPRKPVCTIPGSPPDLLEPPTGCRFHPRCIYARESCQKKEPQLAEIEKKHHVACFLVGK